MSVLGWKGKKKKTRTNFQCSERGSAPLERLLCLVTKLESQRGRGNAGPLGPRSLKAEVQGAGSLCPTRESGLGGPQPEHHRRLTWAECPPSQNLRGIKQHRH